MTVHRRNSASEPGRRRPALAFAVIASVAIHAGAFGTLGRRTLSTLGGGTVGSNRAFEIVFRGAEPAPTRATSDFSLPQPRLPAPDLPRRTPPVRSEPLPVPPERLADPADLDLPSPDDLAQESAARSGGADLLPLVMADLGPAFARSLPGPASTRDHEPQALTAGGAPESAPRSAPHVIAAPPPTHATPTGGAPNPDTPRQGSPGRRPSRLAAQPLRGACPAPEFPARAERLGLHGRVLLRVSVSADGLVTSVVISESSGHSLLDEAAATTVRRWRFLPAEQDGHPIPSSVLVPIRFRKP